MTDREIAVFNKFGKHFARQYDHEATLLKKTIEMLDLLGATYARVLLASNNGVSDIIACYNGKFVALELKSKNGVASAAQLQFIEKVKQAKGRAAVCSSLWEVFEMLTNATRCNMYIDGDLVGTGYIDKLQF